MTNKTTSTAPDQFADLMDRRFVIPGTNIRFGLDAIIGLIPGIGDWIGGLAALYFPVYGAFANISTPVIIRMFVNILIDVIVGAIPVLGDIFDVSWKANTKNVELLNKYQRDPDRTQTRSRWFIWSVVIFFVLLIILMLVAIGWLVVKLFEVVF